MATRYSDSIISRGTPTIMPASRVLRSGRPARGPRRRRGCSPGVPCALERGADEPAEQRMRTRRAALELGVELRGEEERMRRDLDDLDEPAFDGRARESHPLLLHRAAVAIVDLVAMAVSLQHDGLA